jgi:hypothetical protein
VSKAIHFEYGYEPPEYVKADAELEKWLKNKKECEPKKCGSKKDQNQ